MAVASSLRCETRAASSFGACFESSLRNSPSFLFASFMWPLAHSRCASAAFLDSSPLRPAVSVASWARPAQPVADDPEEPVLVAVGDVPQTHEPTLAASNR